MAVSTGRVGSRDQAGATQGVAGGARRAVGQRRGGVELEVWPRQRLSRLGAIRDVGPEGLLEEATVAGRKGPWEHWGMWG